LDPAAILRYQVSDFFNICVSRRGFRRRSCPFPEVVFAFLSGLKPHVRMSVIPSFSPLLNSSRSFCAGQALHLVIWTCFLSYLFFLVVSYTGDSYFLKLPFLRHTLPSLSLRIRPFFQFRATLPFFLRHRNFSLIP